VKVIILSSSKQHQGGVERFSFYLENVLKLKGHEVIMLGKEDLNRFEKFILAIKKKIGFEQPALGYLLGRKAVKQGFDVCIGNGMLGWNITTREKARVINVSHGTWAHAAIRVDKDRNFFKYVMKRYVWGYFGRLAMERAAVCVAVSEEVKHGMEQYYGIRNTIVIPNATETTLFTPMDRTICRGKMKLRMDQTIAIFVGRFEFAKGQHILEGIKNYLEEKGGQLIIAERYSQQELALLYNAADVFLLPSLQEGCSYALLDAMACGLPFLASPVGLIPELQKRGLFSECIVHEQTIDAYIVALEKLLTKTNEENEVLTKALREYIVTHHNLEDFGKTYSNLIETL
jgi:glycosyltransferase involved in cell wall biosynthesis